DTIAAGYLPPGSHRSRFHLAFEGPVADKRREFLMLRSRFRHLGLLRSTRDADGHREHGDNDCKTLHRSAPFKRDDWILFVPSVGCKWRYSFETCKCRPITLRFASSTPR